MRTLLVFASLVVCVASIGSPRLIAFNDSYSVWLNSEDALALESASDNFMDVTHFPTPKLKNLRVDPFPQKCTHQTEVKELIDELEESNMKDTITKLSSYFTRYYNSETGKEAATWIYNQFLEFSAGRQDIDVEFVQHTFSMPSVVARIRGSGDIGATRIILGGHEDSVGRTSISRAPGADDDASGTSTVLEVFRVLAQSGYSPDRTVEFHAYSGEEGGLLGSQAIAKLYYDLDIVVEAMLQLDMTMYGANATQSIGIVTDYVNPDLTAFIRLVVDTYSDFPHTNTKCGYGCSDHASWTKYGYRSAFPFETIFSQSNPYIHSDKDVLANINLNRGIEFAKIAIGYVVELAGGSV